MILMKTKLRVTYLEDREDTVGVRHIVLRGSYKILTILVNAVQVKRRISMVMSSVRLQLEISKRRKHMTESLSKFRKSQSFIKKLILD